jgi:hypothetical protein
MIAERFFLFSFHLTCVFQKLSSLNNPMTGSADQMLQGKEKIFFSKNKKGRSIKKTGLYEVFKLILKCRCELF